MVIWKYCVVWLSFIMSTHQRYEPVSIKFLVWPQQSLFEVVSQKVEIHGQNPAKHILYIIRTVKERTFTISGSPTCSYAGLTLNVLNIGQTTKCMPTTIVL